MQAIIHSFAGWSSSSCSTLRGRTCPAHKAVLLAATSRRRKEGARFATRTKYQKGGRQTPEFMSATASPRGRDASFTLWPAVSSRRKDHAPGIDDQECMNK